MSTADDFDLAPVLSHLHQALQLVCRSCDDAGTLLEGLEITASPDVQHPYVSVYCIGFSLQEYAQKLLQERQDCFVPGASLLHVSTEILQLGHLDHHPATDLLARIRRIALSCQSSALQPLSQAA